MLARMRWHRLVVLLALAGCAGGGECSLVGCVSQLTVALPPGVTQAQACVADVCTSQVRDGTLLVPLGRRAEGDTAAVTVALAGRSYEGEVALSRSRPNGESCPPVCVTGSAYVDVPGGQVRSGRG
jgi:hypothetical protein